MQLDPWDESRTRSWHQLLNRQYLRAASAYLQCALVELGLEAVDFGTRVGTIAGTELAAVAVGIGAAEVAGEVAVGIEAAEAADAFADRAGHTAWVELGRTVFESIVCPGVY